MDFGKVEYRIRDRVNGGGAPGGAPIRKLTLTLVGIDDVSYMKKRGLAELRRRRIMRITEEAAVQGGLLGYGDLCALLLTSLATVKRDVKQIEQDGSLVPLRGRKRTVALQNRGR